MNANVWNRRRGFAIAATLVMIGSLVAAPATVLAATPANDNFADAAAIETLPFDQAVDASSATSEPDEPFPWDCVGTSGPTVWYTFAPSTSQTVTASAGRNGFLNPILVYTGASLATLELQVCGIGGTTFRADAGTTYYIQVIGSGEFDFRLDVTPPPPPPPPPQPNFYYSPGDPSTFDTVQFYDYSYDPGGLIESMTWTFGDGASATGCCPTHRYATDGDYTAQLTLTTFDDWTASTSQVVQVRTHDVAITKLSAPTTAKSGQTRQIGVSVNNRRYLETVEVQLFRSVPGGVEFVAALTQSVPKRAPNQTTDFLFNYTFTTADATLGKVTFQAFATLVGARDTLPADNAAIAAPTKVSR